MFFFHFVVLTSFWSIFGAVGKYDFPPLIVHPNCYQLTPSICQCPGLFVSSNEGVQTKTFWFINSFYIPNTSASIREAEDTKIATPSVHRSVGGVIGVICIKIRQRQHSNRFNSLTPPTPGRPPKIPSKWTHASGPIKKIVYENKHFRGN